MIHLYLKETREDQSQEARNLLRKALKNEYNITEMNIRTGEKGKPYLSDGPCFSISHSRGFVGVAVSDEEIGMDLELVRAFHEKLPERIFSASELAWFRERRETKVDFFTLWTLKESYYKFLGTGLLGFPNGTEFYKTGKQWYLKGDDRAFTVLEEKSLLIAVCSDKQTDIRIHWE